MAYRETDIDCVAVVYGGEHFARLLADELNKDAAGGNARAFVRTLRNGMAVKGHAVVVEVVEED